jgi:hypothetical protein
MSFGDAEVIAEKLFGAVLNTPMGSQMSNGT